MINGRVERCADNIMRRIVPGGPSLSLSRDLLGPEKKFRLATEENVFLPPFSGNCAFSRTFSPS